MALNSTTILDAIVSHAMATGWFDFVNTHEPKQPPGHGLTCAIWLNSVEPVRSSGLNASSARMTFQVRLYTNMLQEPQDSIDPEMLQALDTLLNAYAGDFELGGNARNIDIHGANGVGLSSQAGYININNALHRTVTITLPVIVNDAWNQVG